MTGLPLDPTGAGRARRLSPAVARVLAPNPGPMTLEGTNTWLLGDPARTAPVVVDPGPLIEQHVDAVLEAAHGRVASVLLTHRHPDHAEAAATLAGRADCGVRAADPALSTGGQGLADGDVVSVGRVRVEVIATPGHTSDSVCLLVSGEAAEVWLLTGDTVLGRGSTVIARPDGNLRAYLASLDRLSMLVAERGVGRILPGHGPVVDDPAFVLGAYLEHRRQRLDQVSAALAAGARTAADPVADVLARVYPEVLGTSLQPAAEQSVQAQLDYLDG